MYPSDNHWRYLWLWRCLLSNRKFPNGRLCSLISRTYYLLLAYSCSRHLFTSIVMSSRSHWHNYIGIRYPSTGKSMSQSISRTFAWTSLVTDRYCGATTCRMFIHWEYSLPVKYTAPPAYKKKDIVTMKQTIRINCSRNWFLSEPIKETHWISIR